MKSTKKKGFMTPERKKRLRVSDWNSKVQTHKKANLFPRSIPNAIAIASSQSR